MSIQRGRGLSSLNYIFASFFGAAMVAGAFYYYNYEFSKYKFLDFQKNIFYQKKELFSPKDETYIVLIYSSNKNSAKKLLESQKFTHKILAIDLYQKRVAPDGNLIYLTSGMNTLLSVIQKFNIYKVPSIFRITKFRNGFYKQDSKIKLIGD